MPVQQGADWGFVGGAYEAPMTLQDAQRCINWYPEISENEKSESKMPIALLGCPGTSQILGINQGAAPMVRGLWVLPGGQTALAVVGQFVFVIFVQTAATPTTPPVFTSSQVGTLNTTSGPVCIRDNGAASNGLGGYAVIVDGVNGYYYNLTGTTRTIIFTGGVSTSSPTITLSSIPNGLVIGNHVTLSDSSGFLPPSVGIGSVDFNAVTITISTGTSSGTNAADTITATIPAFGTITDPAFLALALNPTRIAFIEGWLIFNSSIGGRTFFTNATTPYTLLFAGSFFALKDSSTDALVTLFENNRELWLIGERTTEVWYNAGGANFPFSRVPAVGPQIGCAAVNAIARLGPNLVWLAQNEQGQNFVVSTHEYSYERISTHAIDNSINTYNVVSDAIAYAYEEDGHFFYMLTFPSADVTWCYDLKTKIWHQRAAFSLFDGKYHRHVSNCYMNFANTRIVGGWNDGTLYQMSRQYYQDGQGNPLRCQRRAPHLWAKQNRKRVFHGSLQVEFTPGIGLEVNTILGGQNPQAMLRWSNDGGFTWSSEHWQPVGLVGQTRNRAKWNRLGYARDRVYELNFADPVPRDIIGATLFFEPETEEDAQI